MIDMIGVGPFITIPLIIAAAGGPQAMLGWIAGALFALCDGLVWAELGAAMPGAGGSYHYLKEIYGPNSLGPPAVVPVHLAAFVQRAAVHRLGMHRPGALRGISVARPRTHARRRIRSAAVLPLIGTLEVQRAGHAGDLGRDCDVRPSWCSCSIGASP